MGEFRCEGVAVRMSCGVKELRFVEVAMCGSCGGGVAVLGSSCVKDLRGERVAVCVRELQYA